MKDFIKGWVVSIALGMVLIPVGCGKSDVQIANPTGAALTPGVTSTGNCPAGQVSLNGGPCFLATDTSSFNQYCAWYGHMVTIGSVQACMATFNYGSYVYDSWVAPNLPHLEPSNPSDYSALNLGILLRKNDRLTMTSSGNWSHDQQSFVFQWGSGSACKNTIDVSDPTQGLYGSDGTEAFFSGSSVAHSVNNDGYLRVGFNAGTTIGCVGLTVNVSISRCQDSAGVTYPCP